MSPHVKRVALGGSVAGLVSLLVLGAIAVAHRDARNSEGDPSQPLPGYAQQAIEPLAAPPGMIDGEQQFSTHAEGSQYAEVESAPRRFPESNLPPDPQLQANFGSGNGYGSPPASPAARTAAEPAGYELSGLPPLPGFSGDDEVAEAAADQVVVGDTTSADDEMGTAVPDGIAADASDGAVVPAADWQADTQSGGDVVPASGFGWPTPAASSSAPADTPPPSAPPAPSLARPNTTFSGASGFPSSPPGLIAPGLATPSTPSSSLRSADGPPGFLQPSASYAATGQAIEPSGGNTMAPPAYPPAMPLPQSGPEVGGFGGVAGPAAMTTGVSQDLTAANRFQPLPLPTVSGSAAASPAADSASAASPSPGLPAAGLPAAGLPAAGLPAAGPSAIGPSADGFSGGSAVGRPSVSAGATHGPTPSAFADRTAIPGDAPRSTMVSLNRDSSNSKTFAPSVPSSASTMLPLDTPGVRTIDGVQTPQIEILKQSPAEIQVGRAATLTISVKNVGPVEIADVIIYDAVPQGASLTATNPPAQELPGGRLMWSIASLPPGGQHSLSMEIVPEVEGEMGSVATVAFTAQAGFRTVSTLPKLRIDQHADDSVLIGEKAKIRINITNDGTGVARDVSIEEDVPAGLGHQQGGHLGMQLDDLAPGQTRTVELELEAKEPGVQHNTVRLIASNADPVESTVDIEVVAPVLSVEVDGPGRRYLEREASYQISLANRGTAAARNVELIAYLPRGLRFASAGNHGEYLPQEHAVFWAMDELAASSAATTDMTLMPSEEGEFVIRLQSRSDRSNSEPTQKQVRIEGQSELAFSVEDDNDPIEVDGETTYAVRLNNIGTRADSDVQVVVELPRDCELRGVSAPVEYTVAGNQLLFSPIANIKPKEQLLIRFTAALRGEGTQMVRVAVKSGLRPVAVVKEESTQVYSDQ